MFLGGEQPFSMVLPCLRHACTFALDYERRPGFDEALGLVTQEARSTAAIGLTADTNPKSFILELRRQASPATREATSRMLDASGAGQPSQCRRMSVMSVSATALTHRVSQRMRLPIGGVGMAVGTIVMRSDY
jgi:hypothetical protein